MATVFPGLDLIVNGTATSSAVSYAGGTGVLAVVGTFSGSTIKLQFIGPDNVTWIDAGVNTTFLASGAGVFFLPPCQIRVAIVNGPPSGVYATVSRVSGGRA